MKNDYTKINSIAELKKAIENDHFEFFIVVGGFARSSKNIQMTEDNKFSIINEIDDTEQILTEEEIEKSELTNIGKAMKLGSFYCYNT